MKKQVISLALALVCLVSCGSSALATESLQNFEKVKTYTAGQFADVPAGAWYEPNVQSAYELALMEGTSAETFTPEANMTVGQAVTIASRLHSIYYGEDVQFEAAFPWYQPYVDYAIRQGIFRLGQFDSYTRAATRAEFACLLAASVAESALAPINQVSKIPDVPEHASYRDSVYLLYRAGVLMGNDKYGTFAPDTNIRRCEVAAIISRIASVSLRQTVVLEEKPVEAQSVSVSRDALMLAQGKTATVTATVFPGETTDKSIQWVSSNTAVAQVSAAGAITAVAPGTAVITAYCGSVSDNCVVTVVQRMELQRSQVEIKLRIPNPGGLNYYCELIVTNRSDQPITMPQFVSVNKLLKHYSEEVVPAGTTKAVAYYRAPIPMERWDSKWCDMYLGSNSTGYAVMKWEGEQYYAEYGINGITLFYRGNVNGPAL